MSDAIVCPKCDTPQPEEHAHLDLYVCQCEQLLYVKPYREWFVRLSSIIEATQNLARTDPTLFDRFSEAKRRSEN